ncbi:MAG: hypothetical protein ISS79_03760 [Phycisphaerae bacterium]|nr:hypothetical protein [Phycisphaerae bacterium]
MKALKCIVVLAILSVLTGSCTHWRNASDDNIVREGEIVASRHASSLVKIRMDSAILPLDFRAVELLLHSDEVGGRAARDVLGLGRMEGLEFIHIEELQNIPAAGMAEQEAEPGPLPTPEPTKEQSPRQSSYAGYGMGCYVNYPDSWYRSYWPGEQIVISCPAAEKEPQMPVVRTIFMHLEVDLPRGVKPAARQFLDALTKYLGDVLDRTFLAERKELESQLESARTSERQAQAELLDAIKQGTPKGHIPKIGLDPADEAVYGQLNEIVDLSALKPTMPLSAAIDEIRNAVDPPLKIVVLWRDLYDNAEVEPTTEINMGGLSGIRLGTGLDMLLKAVAGGLGEETGYIVDAGVITMATTLSLPAKLETHVYQIPAIIRAACNSQQLADVIMQAVEPDSWFEWNEGMGMGEGGIMPYLDTKLVILQTRENHVKIQKVLEDIVTGVPVAVGRDIPVDALTERMRSLENDKDRLDEELAALNERHLELVKKKDRDDKELKARVRQALKSEISAAIAAFEKFKGRVEAKGDWSELEQVRHILEKIRAVPEKAIEAIDLSHQGFDIYDQKREESELRRQVYSKESELSTASTRIAYIENLLTATKVIDPEVSQIRLAARRLEFADGRVHELKNRLGNLQPPRVTIVGTH